MQGLDALNKAILDVQETVTTVKTFVAGLQQQVTDLQAALTAANNEDPDVAAAAATLEQTVSDLNAVVTPPSPPAV